MAQMQKPITAEVYFSDGEGWISEAHERREFATERAAFAWAEKRYLRFKGLTAAQLKKKLGLRDTEGIAFEYDGKVYEQLDIWCTDEYREAHGYDMNRLATYDTNGQTFDGR